VEDSEVNPLVGSFSLLSSLRDLLLSHRPALRQERPFRRMQALLLGHLFSFARHTITQALVALVYLGSAALDRRWSAWVVLLAGLPVAGVATAVVLLFASLVLLVLGVARGQLRRPGGLTLQAAGMLGFGAIALATLYVDTVLGAYLVAAALLGHAVWDAFHYLRDRVVARSYAEFCGVLDLVLGAAILLSLA
jgi:hypothetical protein